MVDEALFSSKSSEWETPQWLYDKLNLEFGFTLDPCATEKNHKCKKYFTKLENGLVQDWDKDIVFMNPPYGREVGEWIEKAYIESLRGATVVCLIPARTDTRYWHNYCMKGYIRFIKGRLKFKNRALPSYREDGNYKISSAPFPSAIIIFPRTIMKIIKPKIQTVCETYDKMDNNR